MDKNTLLAVVLSVVVITIGFSIQNMLYPPDEVAQPTRPAEEAPAPEATEPREPAEPREPEDAEEPALAAAAPGLDVEAVEAEIEPEEYVYENDLLSVRFDSRGGDIVSFRLFDHWDMDEPVEMIKRGNSDKRAFTLAFGGADADPIDAVFRRREDTDEHTVEFYRDFRMQNANATNQNGEPEEHEFRLRKIYRFQPGEYLFEMDVVLENHGSGAVPVNVDNRAYTLGIGPQIGPSWRELDGRHEYRRFDYYDGNRVRRETLRAGEREQIDERPNWISIAGKYFAIIAVPGNVDYGITIAKDDVPGLEEGAQMYFSRPVIRSQYQTDTFRFFVGPRTDEALARYNSSRDNAFGIRNLDLDEMVETRFMLGWLEDILKAVLNLIYRVIPNYGFAIIMLTLIVKALLMPLTRKSRDSMARMQELSPKIQELREKYKSDPQKLNSETAALYKKEGINPLGGCLPILLQLPFFIAMFGLFNNHFDLRGATFIPGWITDLSAPDSILNFGEFTLPFLGWNDLRLLPVIFVVTQIISSRFMQNPGAGNQSQMKMMMYVLPIVFFFVLYNLPSGLLVYLIFSNVLMAAENIIVKKKRAAASA